MKATNEMTMNERTLRSIIIDMRQVLIGETENHYCDHPEEFVSGDKWYDPVKLTKDWAVQIIYDNIMKGNDKYVSSEIRNIIMERKHIKFMGSQFVRELIEDRVDYDYNKHGWLFPNNYNGDLK